MSIAVWLRDLTAENIDPNEIPPSNKKRRFAETETSKAKRSRTRAPLRDVNMAPRPVLATPTNSPKKQRQGASTRSMRMSMDDTPRADVLSGPSFHPPSSSGQSSISGRSSVSASTRRSQSPAKLAALAEISNPIVRKMWFPTRPEMPTPPDHIVAMLRQISDFERGFGILAEKDRARIQAHVEAYEFGDHCYATDDDRAGLGGVPGLDEVDRITFCSTKLLARRQPESSWNCQSHGPIGQIAWYLSKYRERVEWDNITTADISPSHLLPPLEKSSARRIDYCISATIQKTPRVRDALRNLWKPESSPFHTFNPTYHEPLADQLLCVLIETKRDGSNQEKAYVQIGTWAYALLHRLDELRVDQESKVELPLIPWLFIDGTQWHFGVAVMDRGTKETTMWMMQKNFADATSVRGVLTIIAVLQYLHRWAATTYLAWFEQYCIP